MRAEIAKLRYLPLPRWTALAVLAAVVLFGVIMLVIAPHDPAKYVSVPQSTIADVAELAAMLIGVWIASLEFTAGTMQRTLVAEPDRNRVLRAKLAVTVAVTAIGGLATAAAAGGLSHLAANHAGVSIDEGHLAGALFGAVPQWIAASIIGFAFGLLARSLGGGISLSLALILVLGGALGFIPTIERYSFDQLSSDLSSQIGGIGDAQNGFVVALLGTAAWCAAVLVPGWLRYLRGDLK
jgi:ABC-2 type transport system permease protein